MAEPLTDQQRALIEPLVEWIESGVDKYHRRSNYRITRDDLRSAAYLGLVKAAQHFDPTNGAKFKTYAMFWTDAQLRRVYLEKLRENGYVYSSPVKRTTTMTKVLDKTEMPPLFHSQHPRIDNVHENCLEAERKRLLWSLCETDKERAILRGKLEGLGSKEIGDSIGHRSRQVNDMWLKLRRKLERKLAA